jgi:ADP-ribose pyrophosphatase
MDKPVVPHQIRKVFEGRVFSVVVESITTKKGGQIDMEVVRHPGFVVLIPVTDDGHVVLVRRIPRNRPICTTELPARTLQRRAEGGRTGCHEDRSVLRLDPPAHDAGVLR